MHVYTIFYTHGGRWERRPAVSGVRHTHTNEHTGVSFVRKSFLPYMFLCFLSLAAAVSKCMYTGGGTQVVVEVVVVL